MWARRWPRARRSNKRRAVAFSSAQLSLAPRPRARCSSANEDDGQQQVAELNYNLPCRHCPAYLVWRILRQFDSPMQSSERIKQQLQRSTRVFPLSLTSSAAPSKKLVHWLHERRRQIIIFIGDARARGEKEKEKEADLCSGNLQLGRFEAVEAPPIASDWMAALLLLAQLGMGARRGPLCRSLLSGRCQAFRRLQGTSSKKLPTPSFAGSSRLGNNSIGHSSGGGSGGSCGGAPTAKQAPRSDGKVQVWLARFEVNYCASRAPFAS